MVPARTQNNNRKRARAMSVLVCTRLRYNTHIYAYMRVHSVRANRTSVTSRPRGRKTREMAECTRAPSAGYRAGRRVAKTPGPECCAAEFTAVPLSRRISRPRGFRLSRLHVKLSPSPRRRHSGSMRNCYENSDVKLFRFRCTHTHTRELMSLGNVYVNKTEYCCRRHVQQYNNIPNNCSSPNFPIVINVRSNYRKQDSKSESHFRLT